MLSNWSQVEKAYNVALNAEGSAQRENDKYVESIEGRMEIIKASAEEFSHTAISNDFIKEFLKDFNKLINSLTKLTDIIGGIPMLIGAIGGAYGLLNKQFGTIGFTADKFKEWYSISKSKNKDIKVFGENLGNISSKVLKTISSDKTISLFNFSKINDKFNLDKFSEFIVGTDKFKNVISQYNEDLKSGSQGLEKYKDGLSQTSTIMDKYLNTRARINAEATPSSYLEFIQKSNYGKGLDGTLSAINDYNKLLESVKKLNEPLFAKRSNFAKDSDGYKKIQTQIDKNNDILNQYNSTLANSNARLSNYNQISKATQDVMNGTNKKIQTSTIGFATTTLAVKGLNIALSLTAGLANAVVSGFVSLVAMWIVNGIIRVIKNINKVKEETINASEELSNYNKTLNEHISKLKELKQVQEDAQNNHNTEDLINTNKEILGLQQELIDTYGSQADDIDLVNAKLEEQLELIKNIEKTNSKDFIADKQDDITKAIKNLYPSYTRMYNYTNKHFDFNTPRKDFGIIEYRDYLKDIYDRVAKSSKEKGIDNSKILKDYQKEIDKYSKEKYVEYEKVLDAFIEAFINSSEDLIAGETLSDWKQKITSLINEYNQNVAQNKDNTDVYKQIEESYNILKGQFDVFDTLKSDEGHSNFGKPLKDEVTSWFTGFISEFDDNTLKSKIQEIFKNSKIDDLLGTTQKSEIILDLQTGDYKNKLSSYAQALEYIQSVSKDLNIDIEKIVDLLGELGIINVGEEFTSNMKPIVSNIGNVTNDLSSALASDGGSTKDDATTSDYFSTIINAFEEVSEKGKLATDTVLALNKYGFGSALEYNSNAKTYTIDRVELEKLTKAKIESLKADIETNKINLENARKQDLEDIAKQSNPNIKAKMQLEFDSVDYDGAIKELNSDLYAIEEYYNNFLNEISVNKISMSSIEKVSSGLESVSNAYAKLQKNDSLSANDIASIIEAGYGDILQLDKESGLVSINTEKYKELAQAKILAYKVDTQNAINDLKLEQFALQETISKYKSTLNDSLSSPYDKNNASTQIKELNESLNECNNKIQTNEHELELWNDLGSRVTSTLNGSFNDILSMSNNIESSASTMSSAFKEVKDNGYLSINTAMSLIDSGYTTCVVLDKETNRLTLNANAYKQLAEQKINDQLATLKSIQLNGQNTQQIQSQIQALELLKSNLSLVTSGMYGDNTDYWKAEAEQQFAYLEHLHNMNVVDNEHYYQYLNELNQEYYAGRVKYLDDYRKYEEQVYSGMLEVQKELLESQKDSLDEQKEYFESCKEDIDNQIESIEDEKDYWNDQKDIIQDQIDLLEEKNDEEERALKLKEAQIRLQNALNQKTLRVFTEELGWQWQTDPKEISEAQKELNDALKDEQVAQLENQQDGIDDIIDGLDDQIDSLKDQQDLLDDQIEVLEQQQEALDKEIEAIDKQLNANHVNELTGLTDGINQFTKLSQESINAILGLPENFNTSLGTISEPINNLKSSVDSVTLTLSELQNQSSYGNGLLGGHTQVAQTLTINIDKVVTENPYDFVTQIGDILKQQI